jgi:hypothetical protein
MVDFKTQVSGTYILVDHSLGRLQKGAVGFLDVEGPPDPKIFLSSNRAPKALTSFAPSPRSQGSQLVAAVTSCVLGDSMGQVWRAAHDEPASYWDIVKRANPCMGAETLRRAPRRRKTATGMRPDGTPPARWNTS